MSLFSERHGFIVSFGEVGEHRLTHRSKISRSSILASSDKLTYERAKTHEPAD